MSMYGWVKNVGMNYARSLDLRLASQLVRSGWIRGMAGGEIAGAMARAGGRRAMPAFMGGIREAGIGLGRWARFANPTEQLIRGGTLAGAGVLGAGIMARGAGNARANRGRGTIFPRRERLGPINLNPLWQVNDALEALRERIPGGRR